MSTGMLRARRWPSITSRNVARTVAAGLVGSLALFALLELAARIIETVWYTPRAPDWVRARDRLQVDPVSGEPRPSFFVETRGLLAIRPIYTGGERCLPFHCQAIPMAKETREYRIACFGESTTNGVDLYVPDRLALAKAQNTASGPEQPFCDVVAARLQAALPVRQVTFHNFGGDAFDSRKNLPVIREVARRLEFDLWLVYLGHNEFLYAPDLIEPYSSVPESLRLGTAITTRLALARLIQGAGASRASIDTGARVRRYSRQVFVKTRRYSRAYEGVLSSYERSLREIVALARQAGATVILSELVSNHAQPDRDDLLFNCFERGTNREQMAGVWKEYERALALERSGRRVEAIGVYRGLAATPPGYQPAAVGLARCLLELGRRREALGAARAAIDGNPLPVVATTRLTEIVRRVARETRTPLARPIQEFDRAFLEEPARYERLFLDDCHPTGEGHRVLAEHMVSALREATSVLPSSGER